MNTKQIAPLSIRDFDYVQYDFPFFIASVYLYGSKRWLTPIWPAQPEPFAIPLGSSFHYHRHFELIYVLEGTFTQHLEKSVYRLNAGDCTFLNTQIRHYEGTETDCNCIYINFSPEFIHQLLHNNAAQPALPQHHSNYIMTLCDESSPPAVEKRVSLDFRRTFQGKQLIGSQAANEPKNIINEIISELTAQNWGYIFSVQCLLLRLFETLENPDYFHLTRIDTHSNTEAILFSDIRHYICERNGRISREELASLLHYSPDYLARIIKQQSGISFIHYCQSFWLEKTRELLRTTDMSVADIMQLLGFDNKSNFYHVFSNATGMTPLEYRQHYKKSKTPRE